ncbi:MAG: hypothetical protein RTU63_12900 [Candidatus Thorarchaeota archaeon]
MEPIGTITACLPYVDEDTKLILQFGMSEAKNYNDFAERLCMKAINEDLPALAIYFAYFHAYNQNRYDLLFRLLDANIKTDISKMFELVATARRGASVEWSEYQNAMLAALKSVDDDWISCHVYIAWRLLMEFFRQPEAATDNETLEILSIKIQNDEEFGYFQSYLHRITAIRLEDEGNRKDALASYDLAIQLAKKYDDKEHLTILILKKANVIKQFFNFNEAYSLLEVGKKLSDQLGYISGHALYVHEQGHIAMARGEFEKAISYQNQYLSDRESRELGTGLTKCFIAGIHNQKGDGRTALELINESKTGLLKTGSIICLVNKTWAYFLVNQLQEATNSLDELRESALKFGGESYLGFVHFFEGLLEKKNDEFPSAQYSFSKAIEIFEKHNSIAYTNFTLKELVDTEIETTSLKKDSASLETSGPWMQKLLERVETNDLPGLSAQAKLLQAKFRFKQGRVKESRKLLSEVLKISEDSAMAYLKDMAETLIPDLIIS